METLNERGSAVTAPRGGPGGDRRVLAALGTCILTSVLSLLAIIGLYAKRTPSPMSSAFEDQQIEVQEQRPVTPPVLETATFGAGCFWCTEGVFQQVRGVKSVVSGYCGGKTRNPTYEQVCAGHTGHAEVVQITFDPGIVSYEDLLQIFWATHDPTTLNRQGADVGTQYRSVIFYHNPRQRELAEQYKRQLEHAGVFERPIVTEIAPFTEFFRAEDYHQNYFVANPRQPYCAAVIRPKIEKFRKAFPQKLKSPGDQE